jgi:hypothetical protein
MTVAENRLEISALCQRLRRDLQRLHAVTGWIDPDAIAVTEGSANGNAWSLAELLPGDVSSWPRFSNGARSGPQVRSSDWRPLDLSSLWAVVPTKRPTYDPR